MEAHFPLSLTSSKHLFWWLWSCSGVGWLCPPSDSSLPSQGLILIEGPVSSLNKHCIIRQLVSSPAYPTACSSLNKIDDMDESGRELAAGRSLINGFDVSVSKCCIGTDILEDFRLCTPDRILIISPHGQAALGCGRPGTPGGGNSVQSLGIHAAPVQP